ncbi:DUF6624 domain-containing protein [Streptomyces sp. NPDC046985]|uniref:DUF6624 domain-containing protein n=1 Tax=Streptomyces sp. NPDC046985 TaxID=3155377 RepID=UPI0033EBBA85
MTTHPLRPDLAEDLISRAEQASAHWSRRIRNQLDGIQLGPGRHTDHANAKVLRRILAEHDWPGHRLVGPAGCRAAWQLALHADDEPDLQRSAVRLLHRAVKADDAPAWQWAHLLDRSLIARAEPQEFGTQYRITPDGVQPWPLREPRALDSRRAHLGLPPAASAMAALRRRLLTPPNDAGRTVDDLVPAM